MKQKMNARDPAVDPGGTGEDYPSTDGPADGPADGRVVIDARLDRHVVKLLLAQRGATSADVADRAGVTPATVSAVLSGRSTSSNVERALAALSGVDLDTIRRAVRAPDGGDYAADRAALIRPATGAPGATTGAPAGTSTGTREREAVRLAPTAKADRP